MRKRLGLGLVLVVLAASVVFLHWLGDYYPISSLQTGPLELTLGTLARLLGLGVAYWMLGSGVLLIVARLSAIPAAIRAVSWVTPKPFRRLIERSVASGLVLALSGSAAQASVEPGYVPIPAGDPTTTTTITISPSVPITIAEPVDTLYLPIENPRQPVAVATLASQEVTVRQGDSMWVLAERRLRELEGDVNDAVIAPYWLAIIAANQNRIRSGDPDLIFPGEVLVLPEWG